MTALERIRLRRELHNAPAEKPQPAPAAQRVTLPRDITGTLSAIVARRDRNPEKSRDGTPVVHGSALSQSFCARRHAIHFRYPGSVVGQKSPRPADRLLWAIGRAVEHHVRSQLIAEFGMERSLGVWRCPCEATEHRGFGDSNLTCARCRKPVNVYGEFTLLPHATVIAGNPDYVYRATETTLRVVEIKSIKLDDFLKLGRPLAAHVNQGSTYAVLLAEICPPGLTVEDRLSVFYGAKDYPRPGTPPYKDFCVPVQATAAKLLDTSREVLTPILKGDAKAPLPPRLEVCKDDKSGRARSCTACVLCFALPNNK